MKINKEVRKITGWNFLSVFVTLLQFFLSYLIQFLSKEAYKEGE